MRQELTDKMSLSPINATFAGLSINDDALLVTKIIAVASGHVEALRRHTPRRPARVADLATLYVRTRPGRPWRELASD
jgi:hypothetical protein